MTKPSFTFSDSGPVLLLLQVFKIDGCANTFSDLSAYMESHGFKLSSVKKTLFHE